MWGGAPNIIYSQILHFECFAIDAMYITFYEEKNYILILKIVILYFYFQMSIYSKLLLKKRALSFSLFFISRLRLLKNTRLFYITCTQTVFFYHSFLVCLERKEKKLWHVWYIIKIIFYARKPWNYEHFWSLFFFLVTLYLVYIKIWSSSKQP